MSEKQEIIDMVNIFNLEILWGYNNIHDEIKKNAKILSIFKKKNYDDVLEKLYSIKKAALRISTDDIKGNLPKIKLLKKSLLKSLSIFNSLCGYQIEAQVFLKTKSKKEQSKSTSEYADIMRNIIAVNKEMRLSLEELNTAYVDFLEE